MGKLEKSFYWLSLAFVIYITIGFKLIPAVLKEQIIKNMDENLTQKTTIEKIEFNPFIFKVTIHGFKLSDSDDITSVSFKNFILDFDAFKSIEKRSIVFGGISLKDAFINIIEEKDGSLNLAKLVKPTEEIKEEKEEDSSLNIDFLVSKMELLNTNIKYAKENDDYSLDLKDINYTLYDLGTYKNILSSNDLKLKLNEHTDISIGGAFKLNPFKVYGKISIEDLRLKELLAYKKDILNFDLDENANLNLILNYNLDTTEDLALNLHTDKLELNNINLLQENQNILNLEKLAIKTFFFDLKEQKIKLDDIDFKAFKSNMISDKNGINFTNLIKDEEIAKDNLDAKTKEETTVLAKAEIKDESIVKEEKIEDSKPWKINLSNVKLNNADFIFTDKENDSIAQSKDLNITLSSLKMIGSDIDLNNFKFSNPTLTYNDNKNKLDVVLKNTNINLDTLTLKKGALNINRIDLSKDSLNFNDKKSNLALVTKRTDIKVNNLKIADNKTSIDSITLKSPNLNFDDLKSKLNVATSNIDINVNLLLVDDKKTSINSLELKKLKLDFEDKSSKMIVKSSDINLDVNTLVINDKKTSINSIKLKTPNLSFDDLKSKMKVISSNIDLNVNSIVLDDKKTSLSSLELKTPKLDFDDLNSKMKVKTSNINLSLNSFAMNDTDNISLKSIKLLKPSLNFLDNTNNLKIDAQNIELYVNDIKKVKDRISVENIKFIEPKLDFLDTNSNMKIDAKNLELVIKKLSNSNAGFKILNIDLNQPNIAITLPRSPQNKEAAITSKETITSARSSNSSPIIDESGKIATKIDIGPLNINNAIFSFEDGNLPLPFKTTITKLNGKISEFKNTEAGTTTLEVNGVVDEYGVAKITGIVDPNNIKLLTDINMIFNNITISNFTPYSGKFVGREIKSGKLDLDLKYNIEKSNLDAKNNITITKMELGKTVKSADAVSLPLDIAISLLKDSKGIIDIKLPVTGNIDDPQFSIGTIVWNAFINLMTKAVTAPFSLLGSLFNFDENEISTVNFNLAEDEITPIQKETLDKIAQILVAKPELAIEIAPSYNAVKEDNAIKEKKYFEKNPKDKNLKKEELALILAKEKISEDAVKVIAQNRINNIKEYLVKEKSIDTKQVILLDKFKTSTSSIDLGIQKIK